MPQITQKYPKYLKVPRSTTSKCLKFLQSIPKYQEVPRILIILVVIMVIIRGWKLSSVYRVPNTVIRPRPSCPLLYITFIVTIIIMVIIIVAIILMTIIIMVIMVIIMVVIMNKKRKLAGRTRVGEWRSAVFAYLA